MRSLVIFSGSYTLLFTLHIVFAANDWDMLFRIVAFILITMTFLCGPILWFIDKRLNHEEMNSIKIGYFVSLPLAIGIAYAYTGMEFEFVASATALLLTTLTHGGWHLRMRAK